MNDDYSEEDIVRGEKTTTQFTLELDDAVRAVVRGMRIIDSSIQPLRENMLEEGVNVDLMMQVMKLESIKSRLMIGATLIKSEVDAHWPRKKDGTLKTREELCV